MSYNQIVYKYNMYNAYVYNIMVGIAQQKAFSCAEKKVSKIYFFSYFIRFSQIHVNIMAKIEKEEGFWTQGDSYIFFLFKLSHRLSLL